MTNEEEPSDVKETFTAAIMERYGVSRDEAIRAAERYWEWFLENLRQGRSPLWLTPEEAEQLEEVEPGVYTAPTHLIDTLLDPRRDDAQTLIARMIVQGKKDQ